MENTTGHLQSQIKSHPESTNGLLPALSTDWAFCRPIPRTAVGRKPKKYIYKRGPISGTIFPVTRQEPRAVQQIIILETLRKGGVAFIILVRAQLEIWAISKCKGRCDMQRAFVIVRGLATQPGRLTKRRQTHKCGYNFDHELRITKLRRECPPSPRLARRPVEIVPEEGAEMYPKNGPPSIKEILVFLVSLADFRF